MTANKPVDDFIIIGLDFGTTYSGIAWAYSREPEEIELVTSWDSEFNNCSDVEKAPTQLLYDDKKGTSWGYSIPADKDALKWFKLLLLDSDDVPIKVSKSSQMRCAQKLLDKMKKDPVEVIACYLRKIWNHAIDSIQRTVGAELLQKSPFHVVITLPAIWPPYAQQRMKQAAKTSGILDDRSCGETKLRFICEPEAAALATIKDLSKRSTIKAGDAMVICDAGGGTVDLISYQIESISPFVVKECVKGDGGLCGGVFLDEQFLELVKRKLAPGSWDNVTSAEEKKFLNEDWIVDLPDTCDVASSGSKLKRRKTLELSSSDILSAYTPIVDRIEGLVRRQAQAVKSKLGKPAKYIILVGGFGRSSYLYNKLQSVFSESTVLQSRGNKPWSAICRGAVVHGITNHGLSATLGVTVGARVARNSYGVSFRTDFDPQKHRQSDKVWSEERQEWRAENQMQWFLREGDNMLTKKPVRHGYHRLYSQRIGHVSTPIYICSEFPPPKSFGQTVEKLCEIHWTRNISLESLPTWTNPLGKVYHELRYEVEMTCEDGTVDFTLYHEGKRIGAHNVDVQFR
ncbi:mitochondrial-type heat shock 70 [Fusarium napiforme]|uniref:Mitochondrial-type heat shock 70 n=1 Tax=Fusarium napiforme TaxID=42672 RepID=A0A8H5JXC9_9HYPO|nr:mitochondrial-type heat shock 70 [Fusarium napiforme]